MGGRVLGRGRYSVGGLCKFISANSNRIIFSEYNFRVGDRPLSSLCWCVAWWPLLRMRIHQKNKTSLIGAIKVRKNDQILMAIPYHISAENRSDPSPHILILGNWSSMFSDPLFLNRHSTFITVLEDTQLKILWDQVD